MRGKASVAVPGLGTIALVLALTSLPGVTAATPVFSIETTADYQAAIDDGRISPVPDPYPALTDHYGLLGDDFLYAPPELYPLTDADSGGLGDGLVMAWGDQGGDPDVAQAAAWKYVWPEDPNLVGTLLKLTITAPPCGGGGGGGGCITAVSLTLNDALGNWNSWIWNVSPPPGPGPVIEGFPYLITIDPTIGGVQSGASAFAASAVPFNPAIATSFFADELAVGPGGWANFPAVPFVGNVRPWNYWGPLQVVPEPGTFLLVGLGVAGLALCGRRRLKA